MNTPNKNETTAIRTQLAKSPFLEHSNPLYLTSSFVFEDAEDMRASFAEEKNRNIYIVDFQTRTILNSSINYAN